MNSSTKRKENNQSQRGEFLPEEGDEDGSENGSTIQ